MNIAIITGGETGEREVSIKSARTIARLIDFAETETFVFPEDEAKFIALVKTFALAIPMIHGSGGEDGTLQKIFEHLKIPFVFSRAEAHAIAIDKRKTKKIVETLGMRTPKETNIFPLFTKPVNGGSSVASKLCVSEEELNELIKNNPGVNFLKEETIKGREFTVGILEYQDKTLSLPVVEIIPKGDFFDYENKYDPTKLATELCPARIDGSLSSELQRQALLVHNHLGVKHLSRSDFIVTPGNQIYFLEINTIPGMTDTSLIPKMVTSAGLPLKDILKEWCLTVALRET